MKLRFLPVRSILAVQLVAGSALAGNVLVVDAGGGGNYTDIPPAIAAASDTDAILVKPGHYSGFTIVDKTVSVVADSGASVVVQGQVRVDNLSSNRWVLLAGLQITAASTSAFAAQNDLGGVRLHGCAITGADATANCLGGSPGADLAADADVAFTACTISGGRGGQGVGCVLSGNGGAGILAQSSNVAVYDVSSSGGDGGPGVFQGASWMESSAGGNGGAGCSLHDGFLFASGSILQGGDGGRGGDGTLSCFGTDHGCGGSGGDAVFVGSAPPPNPIVVLLGNSLLRGSGGASGQPNPCFGPACPGPNGVQIDAPAGSVTQLSGAARSLAAPSVARELTAIPLAFHGVPGDEVWVYLARRPVYSYDAPFHGVNLTPLPPLARLVHFGTIPASGTLSTHIVLPDYGVDSKTHFMQAVFRDSSNNWFLGSPMTLVELDSAF